MEQGRHHRSVALRLARGLRGDRPPSARRLTHRISTARDVRRRRGRRSATAFPTVRSSTSCARIPQHRGLLYAGTERGVYVSFDDGAHWQPLQLNLPVTSVRDIAVHGDDIVVATHGRAFWVLDDVAPLRQIADARRGGDYLFAPAIAYRLRPAQRREARRFRATKHRRLIRRTARRSTTTLPRARTRRSSSRFSLPTAACCAAGRAPTNPKRLTRRKSPWCRRGFRSRGRPRPTPARIGSSGIIT